MILPIPNKDNYKNIPFLSDSNPVEIEIGCGRGLFLMTRAEKNPDINFIGIDYSFPCIRVANERKGKKKITNLFFLQADITDVFEYIPHNRISIFHMYFPDPWPKKRHHKRRTFQENFLKFIYDCLTLQGKFEIATDHEEYFFHIKNVLQKSPIIWGSVKESINERIFMPENQTVYETKYLKEAKPIYYLELCK